MWYLWILVQFIEAESSLMKPGDRISRQFRCLEYKKNFLQPKPWWHLRETPTWVNHLQSVFFPQLYASLSFQIRAFWSIYLRAWKTFKIWNFHFAQILAGIVKRQHVLIPFNFFFKFSHCLTLFPLFSVHVNWILFYVTIYLKFCYRQILRKICHVVTKAEHEEIILYELGKWW